MPHFTHHLALQPDTNLSGPSYNSRCLSARTATHLLVPHPLEQQPHSRAPSISRILRNGWESKSPITSILEPAPDQFRSPAFSLRLEPAPTVAEAKASRP